jgi:hypothetical protein
MKNKIEDLRNHMFAAIEELNEMELVRLTPEERKAAIDRAKAIASLGTVIVNSVKTEVDFYRAGGKKNMEVMGSEAKQLS